MACLVLQEWQGNLALQDCQELMVSRVNKGLVAPQVTRETPDKLALWGLQV